MKSRMTIATILVVFAACVFQIDLTVGCSDDFLQDGLVCRDINECLKNNGGCDVQATCTNTIGSFKCTCNAGYNGDGKTCADINECLTNNGGCVANSACANTPGSNTCTCNPGYTGDGKICTDVNECQTNSKSCDARAVCTNTPGSFTCTCNAGLFGDGKTCTDYALASQSVSYTVKVPGQPDQATMSVGGWIVIMWRVTGPSDGNWALPWTNYVNGFGFNSSYTWLGLERIYQLTSSGSWKLRVEYTYSGGNWVFAEYSTFSVGSSSTSYTLNIDGYSGNEGNTIRGAAANFGYWNENGMKFSSADADNDKWTDGSCVAGGPWWYNHCGLFIPTRSPPSSSLDAQTWRTITEVHLMIKQR